MLVLEYNMIVIYFQLIQITYKIKDNIILIIFKNLYFKVNILNICQNWKQSLNDCFNYSLYHEVLK